MVPIIEGKHYHFAPRGLYNGLILLGDDETKSYWDHITGQCVYGKMKGKQMSIIPIIQTTVSMALEKWSNLNVAISKPPFLMRLITPFMKKVHHKAAMPPGFMKTIDKLDTRLPKMESGLGIITKNTQRFYPLEIIKKNNGEIHDNIEGHNIHIVLDKNDRAPIAYYTNSKGNSEKPMQLFSRWYGFSLTFPNCEIYHT
jgi:hypothetical protein